MKIVIGSDHAGFSYKREIIAQLRAKDITVVDVGTDSEAPVSYVPFCREVAEGVASGRFDRGIVLGGSGNGEAMAANRVKGVRCALCWCVETAKLARQHNDTNVLSIGERVTTSGPWSPRGSVLGRLGGQSLISESSSQFVD
jgi:ribose 5-phosphate isomerase B